MILTRQQREELVLDLYSKGKSTREIAEEVRMSFRDISAILDKARNDKEKSKMQSEKMSQSAQAYRLFSDSKPPIDVAIALNLRQAEVEQYYQEYWKLKQQYDLYQVYEEIKGDIGPLVKLYKLAKAAGMNTQQIVKLLAIADNHLPSIEQRYEKLKREEESLEAGNRNSALTLKDLKDHISTTRKTLEQYELSCRERKIEMDNLNREYRTIETFVNQFKDKNEGYLEITKSVEERLTSILRDSKTLLKLALMSLTESIRNNEKIYTLIFHNISPITDYSPYDPAPFVDPAQNKHVHSEDYNTEARVAMIVDEAEKLYTKLVKDCIKKIISNQDFSISPSPPSPP